MSLIHKVAKFYFKLRGVPSCEELDHLAYDFLDEKLSEKEQAAIEKHMRLCPPCLHYIHSYRKTKTLGENVEPPPMAPDFKFHLKKMFD